MTRYLVPDLAGAIARARTDFDAAPLTCRTVWAGLIHPGDVMFTHYPERWRLGFPKTESRITWAYDRFCQPSAPGRMSAEYLNVFAAFVGESTAFFDACRAAFYSGRKPLTIRGTDDCYSDAR